MGLVNAEDIEENDDSEKGEAKKVKKMSPLERQAWFLKKMNTKFKKAYGDDILIMGDALSDFLPLATGFPNLDWGVSGIGGYPRGGMTLIHGMESTGKSTLVLESITNAMDDDPNMTALYIDVENALTKGFLKFKNMHPDRLSITPLNNEDGLVIAEHAIRNNVYDLICIDSLAKLEPTKEMEKDIGEKKQRGRRAVLITEFLCRITFILRHSKTALICINQEVSNQDPSPYAPKMILPGGHQQKFSANLRIEIKRIKTLKIGESKVGYECQMTAIKNKTCNHEKVMTKFIYMFDRGFVREAALVTYLIAIGFVKELPKKMYAFEKKEIYPDPFKMSEVAELAKKLKADMGLDLYKIPPGSTVQFEKNEEVEDIASENEPIEELESGEA